MKHCLGVLSISLLGAMAHADPAPPTLTAVVPLPVEQLQAVEANGEILFLSRNGRFVIQGRLMDAWHKKPLETIEAIRYATDHVDVDVMGLPLDQMNTITLAGGPKRVVVFVDPRCHVCKDFIRQAQERTDQYAFEFVVVPALGDESNRLSRGLFCAADKSNALEALLQGTLGQMAQQPNCDTTFYDLTLTTAQLMGVQAVPFVIAPDGRFRPGAGADIWDWMGQEG